MRERKRRISVAFYLTRLWTTRVGRAVGLGGHEVFFFQDVTERVEWVRECVYERLCVFMCIQ